MLGAAGQKRASEEGDLELFLKPLPFFWLFPGGVKRFTVSLSSSGLDGAMLTWGSIQPYKRALSSQLSSGSSAEGLAEGFLGIWIILWLVNAALKPKGC